MFGRQIRFYTVVYESSIDKFVCRLFVETINYWIYGLDSLKRHNKCVSIVKKRDFVKIKLPADGLNQPERVINQLSSSSLRRKQFIWFIC